MDASATSRKTRSVDLETDRYSLESRQVQWADDLLHAFGDAEAGDSLPGVRPGKYRSVMENSTAHRAG